MSFAKKYATNKLGVLEHKGSWDALTNNPTLNSSIGDKGDYYIVSVAGSTNLDGITDWQIGDWALFSGSVWQKIDNSDSVALITSVAGRTGDILLTSADVGLGNVPNVDATLRSNHTGTQLASTISDFTTAVQAVTIDAAKVGNGTVSNAEFATLDGITTSTTIQSQLDAKANNTNTTLIGTINWAKNTTDPLVDISELVAFASTLGVIEGGQITVNSGLTVNVAATIGYTMTSGAYATHKLVKVSASATTITVPANSNVYLYYTSSGVLSYNVTQPSSRSNVLLGRVVTNATDVTYIEKSELDAHHWANYVDRFLREALGPIFSSGATVTENSTNPRQLDINSGVYYYGEHRLTLSSQIGLSFTAYYRNGSGGYSAESPSSTVSNSFYDNGSGTLASTSSGYYVKHLLVAIKEQTGTQKFLLIYGDSQWASLQEANSASLPVSPDFLKNTFVRIASIIVKQGTNNIQNIIDERPRVGFAPSAITETIVTDHGNLQGLSDDDHTQYLLANGSRPMSGDLDMGNHAIFDALTVNGVTVEAHASRHQPGGADAIPTATAVSIATVNAEGTSTSLARADHTHKIDDSFITNSMLAGSIDATKISNGSVSNIEFDYLDGVTSAIQTQINSKEPTITAGTTSQYWRGDKTWQTLDKTAVGLSNVPNVDATLRSNHTGTQLASTISDFTTAVQAVTIDAAKIDGGVVSNAEFATLDGIATGVSIQSQIDSKQATITGAATTVTSSNLTASKAVVSDASGKIAASSVTSTELGYVSGVTSAIQTQINSKEPTITAGTTSQYWRGDKSFQTLNATAVANTPSGNITSTTVQAALNELDTIKQPTGNYITALTGDVTASGPGSSAATLSNTGVVAGTYDSVTVDTKGRITSANTFNYSYKTTTPASVTTVTYTTVAQLTTISLPVGLYKFSFAGQMQSAATGTGVGVRISGVSATVTTAYAQWRIKQAADGVNSIFEYDQLTAATNVTSASVANANANFNVNGDGVFRVTVAGTVAIQIRGELANSAITLQSDAVFTIEAV